MDPRLSRLLNSTVTAEDCLYRHSATKQPAREFLAQRGHPVFHISLPSQSMSLSCGELAPGAMTSLHRHAYEALAYILEGSGYSELDGLQLPWQAGDAVYTPPWCWHRHVASAGGRVRYLTTTNMPLPCRLGQTELREEAK